MYLRLHDLIIHLQSDDALINRLWRALFAGWPVSAAATAPPDMVLQLSLTAHLPILPDTPPFFSDEQALPEGGGILSVYHGDADGVRLHFLDGALVAVPLDTTLAAPKAAGWLTQRALAVGRFEDITLTSLAPLLRRRGYFFVHAFAVARDDRALLLVGPSGSGKTTTGLSLLLAGWQLLANDALLLQERAGIVYALPTPGSINVRPPTLDLLPDLRRILGAELTPGQMDVTQALMAVFDWSEPAPVTAVYAPQIESRPSSALRRQNRAICLAHLMAESVDQWDQAMLPVHMNLLQTLSQQAAAYVLQLGADVERLPALLTGLDFQADRRRK